MSKHRSRLPCYDNGEKDVGRVRGRFEAHQGTAEIDPSAKKQPRRLPSTTPFNDRISAPRARHKTKMNQRPLCEAANTLWISGIGSTRQRLANAAADPRDSGYPPTYDRAHIPPLFFEVVFQQPPMSVTSL
jgi:hypothetical protein